MTNKPSERGQALIVLVLLVVGVFAFFVIYGMNANQNMKLANTVGDSIDNAISSGGSIVTDIGEGYYDAQAPEVVWTKAHAARHGEVVQDIDTKCNESTGNVAATMRHLQTGRQAFICFVEGYWVVTIKQFDPAKIAEFGDDVVTAFDRIKDPTVQKVMDYLARGGYVQ